jgi:hypothetical protein
MGDASFMMLFPSSLSSRINFGSLIAEIVLVFCQKLTLGFLNVDIRIEISVFLHISISIRHSETLPHQYQCDAA